MNEADKRKAAEDNAHALAQKKYVERLSQNASRKCVWVPNGEEQSFAKAVAKLKDKWNSK